MDSGRQGRALNFANLIRCAMKVQDKQFSNNFEQFRIFSWKSKFLPVASSTFYFFSKFGLVLHVWCILCMFWRRIAMMFQDKVANLLERICKGCSKLLKYFSDDSHFWHHTTVIQLYSQFNMHSDLINKLQVFVWQKSEGKFCCRYFWMDGSQCFIQAVSRRIMFCCLTVWTGQKDSQSRG